MGNSHHKRKAPSGPRTRSFWRFGRSAKRPAGRGWGWGRGRRGGGSSCRSRRRRCCPLLGLVGCEFGGPGIPRTDPTPHMQTETHVRTNTRGRAHVHVHNLQSHTQHPLRCMDMQTQNHIHIHTHTIAVGGTDPEIQVHIPMYTVYPATRTPPQSQIQTHACRYSCPTS